MSDKLKILVLAGGFSEERQVSLITAEAIVGALKRLEHEISVLDAASGKSLLDNKNEFLLKKDADSPSKLALKQSDKQTLAETVNMGQFRESDLVFIALHGGAGEDGTIQALLDLAGIRYTGSGMLASALAMNKAMAKKLIEYEHIPTPRSMLLSRSDNIDKLIEKTMADFSLPLIIKPNNSGSTVGLSLVKDKKDLPKALETAFKISPQILVETFIKGREITAAVFDGSVFPLAEIIPSNEIYDYNCKYTKGKSKYICPAELPDNIAENISDFALRAYQVLGCSGLARIDFILEDNKNAWFLEVNTIPGMTELSLAPMAALKAGISFDELIEKICRSALDK